MRVLTAFTILFLAGGAVPGAAQSLFETSVIVTGMDLRSRPAGLARALAQVLAKASGNPAWLNDPRVAATDPAPLLQAITYIDRETDLPTHDEQGTRDRPYDLVAAFDPAAIERHLRGWNDSVWPEPRPRLAAAVTIRLRTGESITMHADTGQDERHRGALLAAAHQFGVVVALPTAIDSRMSSRSGPVLRGTVVWSDADFGWVSDWLLVKEDKTESDHWGLRGVSFDEIYRDGVAGVVRRLSGHSPTSGSTSAAPHP